MISRFAADRSTVAVHRMGVFLAFLLLLCPLPCLSADAPGSSGASDLDQSNSARIRRQLLQITSRLRDMEQEFSSQTPAQAQAGQFRAQIRRIINEIQSMKEKLAAQPEAGGASQFQKELTADQDRAQVLERQLDRASLNASATGMPDDPSAQQATKKMQPMQMGRGPETTPGITTGLQPADIYNNGFFVKTVDNSFSMYVNGLFQTRFTYFKPQASVGQLGASTTGSDNFDVYLGRLAFSGSVFDPSIKYFAQFQGSTAGNSNTETFLDWFVAKTYSKYLTVQMGRFWTPFTFEYYMNPGNYLFADLSTAEFAFVLPRAVGLEAYGQAGRLSYAGVVANSIPALDAAGQENFSNRLAYIGHLQYDLLAPYGYVETDPNPSGAKQPELTLWGSVAYNPIAGASSFENVAVGDKTFNGTGSVAFRDAFFTLQATGYFRSTTPYNALPSNDSYGYSEQAGYYLVPGRVELAERVSGVNWGAPQFLLADFAVNTWYSGPNFPYHNITEHSIGLNYYLHGHNAKVQASYSYLTGDTFSGVKFGGNRVWLQAQVMF